MWNGRALSGGTPRNQGSSAGAAAALPGAGRFCRLQQLTHSGCGRDIKPHQLAAIVTSEAWGKPMLSPDYAGCETNALTLERSVNIVPFQLAMDQNPSCNVLLWIKKGISL
jgi:hypothetical protein